MTAFNFCKQFHLPMDFNGEKPIPASNSCLKRWLESGSVLINGIKPKPNDEIKFPVTQLIFFPKSNRKVTYQDL